MEPCSPETVTTTARLSTSPAALPVAPAEARCSPRKPCLAFWPTTPSSRGAAWGPSGSGASAMSTSSCSGDEVIRPAPARRAIRRLRYRDRMADDLCLLQIHAHPDDEASKGAGTSAKYAAEGIRNVLVCCTGGEEGEILNPAMDRPEIRADITGARMAER